MGKLIDADMLLSWFESWNDNDEFSVGYIKGLIEEAEKVGAWIPCSERLPEKSGPYLVTTPFDRMAPVCSRYFNKRGEQSFWSGHPMNKVVAWMPLPQPYKK